MEPSGAANLGGVSVTQRSVNITVGEEQAPLLSREEYLKLSPKEKFRALRERRYVDEKSGKMAASIGPLVIFFCITTMPLIMLFWVLPFTFPDDTTTLWLWRAVFAFCSLMTTANWLLMFRYDSRVRQPIPRPDHLATAEASRPHPGSKAPFLWSFPPDPDSGMCWRWCQRCETYAPPRTHHCPLCNVCVLLRDHHCFFTGNCVGAFNQRFFVPFAFYCCSVCLMALYFGPAFALTNLRAAQANCWLAFLFPPYLFFVFCFSGVSLVTLLSVLHLCIVSWGWLLCLIAFGMQLGLNLLGRTSHEVHRSDSILWPRVGVINRLTIAQRQRQIYGPLWALNFVCPLHWMFSTPQDGIHHPGVFQRPSQPA